MFKNCIFKCFLTVLTCEFVNVGGKLACKVLSASTTAGKSAGRTFAMLQIVPVQAIKLTEDM